MVSDIYFSFKRSIQYSKACWMPRSAPPEVWGAPQEDHSGELTGDKVAAHTELTLRSPLTWASAPSPGPALLHFAGGLNLPVAF